MCRVSLQYLVKLTKMYFFNIVTVFAIILTSYIVIINVLYHNIPNTYDEFDFSVGLVKTNNIRDMKYLMHYCAPHDVYKTYHNQMRSDVPVGNISSAQMYTFMRGDEGLTAKRTNNLRLLDYFQLEHVGVAIRHGDRHHIHVMPIPQYFLEHGHRRLAGTGTNDTERRKLGEDEFSYQWYDSRAMQYKSHLKKFAVQLVDLHGIPIPSDHLALEDSILDTLSDHRVFNRFEKGIRKEFVSQGISESGGDMFAHDVDNAQLTTRGFMQHVSLGKHLLAAYGSEFPRLFKYEGKKKLTDGIDVAEGVHLQDNIYVRSTKYDRTVQSASALLLGFLGTGTANSSDAPIPIPIQVIESEDLEVMHGVGIRTHSLQAMLAPFVGDAGMDAEKRNEIMAALHPWKSVPEHNAMSMDITSSSGISVAYDNGCALSYSLAVEQQYRQLSNNNKTESIINKQCRKTVDYLKSCDQNDLTFIKHKLLKILHGHGDLSSNGNGLGLGTANAKTMEKSKKQLLSMASTEIVDSILVPLCHYEDSVQVDDQLLRPRPTVQNGATSTPPSPFPIVESTGDLLCQGKDSSGRCIDETFLLGLKQHADSVYCNRYYESGGGTGREATNLAIYPFLKDILHHITSNMPDTQYCRDIYSFVKDAKSMGDVKNYERTRRYTNTIYNTGIHYGDQLCSRNRNRNATKRSFSESQSIYNEKVSSFSLFSGHDTVILPVLTALGVFKSIGGGERTNLHLRGKHEIFDEMHCEWPPYASRIVFEVYNPNSLLNSNPSLKSSVKNTKVDVKLYQQKFPFFLPFKASSGPGTVLGCVEDQEKLFRLSMLNGSGSVSSLLNLYSTASASYVYEPYIRILYNGKVITPYISACKDYHRMVLRNKVKQSESLRMKERSTSSTRSTLLSFIETNSIMDNKYHNGMLVSTDLCPLSVYEAHLETILGDSGGGNPSSKGGPFYKDDYQYVNQQYENRCNTVM